MKQISIIFPNQLFRESPLLQIDCELLILEDSLFFGNDQNFKYSNHINKLIFLKASIDAYKEYLKQKGLKVKHVVNQKSFTTIDYLKKYLGNKYKEVNVIDPNDYLLSKRLSNFTKSNHIKLNIFKSPMFLTDETLVNAFKLNDKKPLMARFYQNQRKSQNILINKDGSPSGGKWSFDELNRKKLPKNIEIPKLKKLVKNKFVIEAEEKYSNNKNEYLGISKYFFYPTTFEEVDDWLNDFFENRFSFFGDYEDALTKKDSFLWHSLLSPLLNVGLITPRDVIDKALNFSKEHDIPLNSLEGFVRQVVGWREFISLVYQKYGVQMRTKNFWDFEYKAIPKSFYNASTGIEPVDNVIKNILKFGYCHHIERLMILGNFMLLCRIHPDEVYKWFMEMFVDSYDWVMVPNVYGMSQFSDGGIFSTKPYISSSNYIKKMSDYKDDYWCKVWDGLFWKFIKDYEIFFKKQYRLSMLTRNLNKMKSEQLETHLNIATDYLSKLH